MQRECFFRSCKWERIDEVLTGTCHTFLSIKDLMGLHRCTMPAKRYFLSAQANESFLVN